jgi:hypothetical protein
LALVRICQLEDLEALAALLAQLQGGASLSPTATPTPGSVAAAPQAAPVSTTAASGGAKKKSELDEPAPLGPGPQSETPAGLGPGATLDESNAASIWEQVVAKVGGLAGSSAGNYSRVAISAPNCLVVHLKPGYTFAKAICQRPDQLVQFQRALAELTGRATSVQFAVDEAPEAAEPAMPVRSVSPHQRLMEVAEHPMIRRAGELFGAQPVRVDEAPAANAKET